MDRQREITLRSPPRLDKFKRYTMLNYIKKQINFIKEFFDEQYLTYKEFREFMKYGEIKGIDKYFRDDNFPSINRKDLSF